ncbi:MAG: hypothetical protein ABFC24_12090 [Methanoregulaceae archaeon]
MTDTGESQPGETSSNSADGAKQELNCKKEVIFWYSIAFAVILAAISIFVYYQSEPFFPPIIKLLIWVTCSGGIGGFLYNAMGYNKYSRIGTTDASFKADQYFPEYIFRPITASFLGLFVFFLVAGGLMSLGTNITVQDISGYTSLKTIMFYCALSFLAGWANNKVIKKMDDITTAIFAEDPSKSEPAVPASKESIVVAAAAAAKSAEEAAAAAKVAAAAAESAASLVQGETGTTTSQTSH